MYVCVCTLEQKVSGEKTVLDKHKVPLLNTLSDFLAIRQASPIIGVTHQTSDNEKCMEI